MRYVFPALVEAFFMRGCVNEGCEREIELGVAGLCRRCWNYYYQTDTLPVIKNDRSTRDRKTVCRNDDCYRKVEILSQKLCRRCYNWKSYHGVLPILRMDKTDAEEKVSTRERRGCSVQYCKNPHSARGLCKRCYQYFKQRKKKPILDEQGQRVKEQKGSKCEPGVEDLGYLRKQWERAFECYASACGAEAMLCWRKCMKKLERIIARLEDEQKHAETD